MLPTLGMHLTNTLVEDSESEKTGGWASLYIPNHDIKQDMIKTLKKMQTKYGVCSGRKYFWLLGN